MQDCFNSRHVSSSCEYLTSAMDTGEYDVTPGFINDYEPLRQLNVATDPRSSNPALGSTFTLQNDVGSDLDYTRVKDSITKYFSTPQFI